MYEPEIDRWTVVADHAAPAVDDALALEDAVHRANHRDCRRLL